MVTLKNLITGVPLIYIGDTDAVIPELDDSTGTLTPDPQDWTVISGTDDGVTLTYEVEVEDKFVDSHLGKVKTVPVKETGSVEFSLPESNLASLQHAFALGTYSTVAAAYNQVGQQIIKAGGKGTIPVKQMLLIGTSPDGYYHCVHIFRCQNVSSYVKEYKKGWTSVKCKFDILADTTATAGEDMFAIYSMTDLQTS